MGAVQPGTVCTLSTGWGWTAAAQIHMRRARELFETGTVTFDHLVENQGELLRQDEYDTLVAGWARSTGRPLR